MSYEIYNFVNFKGVDEISAWREKLQPGLQAIFDEKVDKLREHGNTLYPSHFYTDSGETGIRKLRMRKLNVQLRPLICAGPVDENKELTFLKGAKEVQSRYVPQDALRKAKENKQSVIDDPSNRRVLSE